MMRSNLHLNIPVVGPLKSHSRYADVRNKSLVLQRRPVQILHLFTCNILLPANGPILHCAKDQFVEYVKTKVIITNFSCFHLVLY
jgi:hypothetical protein